MVLRRVGDDISIKITRTVLPFYKVLKITFLAKGKGKKFYKIEKKERERERGRESGEGGGGNKLGTRISDDTTIHRQSQYLEP